MKIREYIEKNRLDPVAFALSIGISVTTIYRYMAGRIPHRKTAYKIEEATNGLVTVEEMMGEKK
jgi:hypothetical protein